MFSCSNIRQGNIFTAQYLYKKYKAILQQDCSFWIIFLDQKYTYIQNEFSKKN